MEKEKFAFLPLLTVILPIVALAGLGYVVLDMRMIAVLAYAAVVSTSFLVRVPERGPLARIFAGIRRAMAPILAPPAESPFERFWRTWEKEGFPRIRVARAMAIDRPLRAGVLEVLAQPGIIERLERLMAPHEPTVSAMEEPRGATSGRVAQESGPESAPEGPSDQGEEARERGGEEQDLE